MAEHKDRPIVLRKQASENGLKRYFTGRPCVRGHLDERSANFGQCISCIRENSLVYGKKLRTEDWDRYKKYQKKHQKKQREASLKWRAKHPEKVREYKKKDYRKHKDKRKNTQSKWGIKNWDKVKSYRTNRKARLRKAQGKHSAKEIRVLLERQKYKCAECHRRIGVILKRGELKLHVDHIIPIFLNGSNDIKNLQCLCEPCNLDKGAKHPIEYAQRKGRLL